MPKVASSSVQVARLNMVSELVVGGKYNFEYLNLVTNGRMYLASMSIKAFLSSPMFGIGAFYHSLAGGHSFIFDTLAYYGVVGAAPIFLMFIRWMIIGIYNIKIMPFNWSNLAATALIISVFLFSFFNPYIFHSRIDYLIYFAAGTLCGDNYLIKMNKFYKRI